MGLLYWIVVGLIAGWLAGQVMKGGGYGAVVDIILGMVGGIVGLVFGCSDLRAASSDRSSWPRGRRHSRGDHTR